MLTFANGMTKWKVSKRICFVALTYIAGYSDGEEKWQFTEREIKGYIEGVIIKVQQVAIHDIKQVVQEKSVDKIITKLDSLEPRMKHTVATKQRMRALDKKGDKTCKGHLQK